jgi:hypothetical protein
MAAKKKFGKRIYNQFIHVFTKTEANKSEMQLEEMGFLVKVIPSTTPALKGYEIWIAKRRK